MHVTNTRQQTTTRTHSLVLAGNVPEEHHSSGVKFVGDIFQQNILLHVARRSPTVELRVPRLGDASGFRPLQNLQTTTSYPDICEGSGFVLSKAVRDLPKQIPSLHTDDPSKSRIESIDHNPNEHKKIMAKSRASAEKEVRSWGFGHVFTWSDGP